MARQSSIDRSECPTCMHSMMIHNTVGTCSVCTSTRADSPCFTDRGQIVVAKVGDPGALGEYIGRRVRGHHGSPLGNPFKITTEDEREATVRHYETWLRELIAAGDATIVAELDRLAATFRREQTLTLLCWCKPRACHGDVIARVLRERLSP